MNLDDLYNQKKLNEGVERDEDEAYGQWRQEKVDNVDADGKSEWEKMGHGWRHPDFDKMVGKKAPSTPSISQIQAKIRELEAEQEQNEFGSFAYDSVDGELQSLYAELEKAKKQGVAEGMPSSVIKTKQKLSMMTPEELYARFKEVADRTGKDIKELAINQARRHGLDELHYWKKVFPLDQAAREEKFDAVLNHPSRFKGLDEDGPGMLDQPDFSEVREYLDELENHLYEAIDRARYLARIGRNISGPFQGQLKSYLIPHLEAWISDENQPGSIATLRGMLEGQDLEETAGNKWVVSFQVEEKSYDDRPGREYEDSVVITAGSAEEAFQKVKANKSPGKMRYDFKVRPAADKDVELDEAPMKPVRSYKVGGPDDPAVKAKLRRQSRRDAVMDIPAEEPKQVPWQEVVSALGQGYPDLDPTDALKPIMRKYGVSFEYLNKLAQKNGYADVWEVLDEFGELGEGAKSAPRGSAALNKAGKKAVKNIKKKKQEDDTYDQQGTHDEGRGRKKAMQDPIDESDPSGLFTAAKMGLGQKKRFKVQLKDGSTKTVKAMNVEAIKKHFGDQFVGAERVVDEEVSRDKENPYTPGTWEYRNYELGLAGLGVRRSKVAQNIAKHEHESDDFFTAQEKGDKLAEMNTTKDWDWRGKNNTDDELNSRPGAWRGPVSMGKRTKKDGTPSKEEKYQQDNLKARIKMKKKVDGGLTGPKGVLPEDSQDLKTVNGGQLLTTFVHNPPEGYTGNKIGDRGLVKHNAGRPDEFYAIHDLSTDQMPQLHTGTLSSMMRKLAMTHKPKLPGVPTNNVALEEARNHLVNKWTKDGKSYHLWNDGNYLYNLTTIVDSVPKHVKHWPDAELEQVEAELTRRGYTKQSHKGLAPDTLDIDPRQAQINEIEDKTIKLKLNQALQAEKAAKARGDMTTAVKLGKRITSILSRLGQRRVEPAVAEAEEFAINKPMTQDDYRQRRATIQKLQMDPRVAKDPSLKTEIMRKLAKLNQQAQAAGLAIAEDESAE